MSRKNLIIFGVIVAALILAPVGWWLASPLWRTDVVDEAFPFDVPTAAEAEAMVSNDQADELEAKLVEVMEMADEMKDEISDEEMANVSEQVQEAAAAMPDKEMEEEMPEAAAAEWIQVSTGMFSDADAFHQGSGTATIFPAR